MTSKIRARMRDVAELAGVGTMTVSRVINGSVPVSDEVRVRVLDAIAKLDYRPNEIARSLRESRTRSIGIIVPSFYDTFFSSCAHAISQVAQRQGYSVMVTTSSEDAASEYREAGLLARRNVDGLVVIPAQFGTTQLSHPEFALLPIIALDRPLNSRNADPAFSGSAFRGSVTVDNADGARLAVEHLIAHSHSRILYLSLSNDLFTLKSRHEGYEKAMQEAGLVPEVYFECATPESTFDYLRDLQGAGRMPSAIFSSNNLVTQHALHALATLDLNVPGDVALIGFDDFQMFDIFMPPITVVRQPIGDLGRIAAEMLLDNLRTSDAEQAPGSERRDVTLPVELVIRRSCGCER